MTRQDLVATTLGGRYRIVGRLGKGGAGHVYLAIQEPLDREVAVKVLRTDLAPTAQREFEARFLREAALAGRLNHPNLVTVHDYGAAEGGLQYVVMERLRGPTLSRLIEQGPLEPRRAARIACDLARGLRHAHASGLVHRDVKPRNVMLERDDEGEVRPVLLDFGLVKAPAEGDTLETAAGTFMGTPAYMSPEQATGSPDLDGRADVYALGCVLFKMLCAKPPFTADDALTLAMQHISVKAPRFADRVPDIEVPPGLESIVLRCLEKAPADRYDAAGLVEALEGWLADPAGPETPTGLPLAAGAVGAATAAALVVVCLGGGALAWWSRVPAPLPVPPGPLVTMSPAAVAEPALEPRTVPDPELAPAAEENPPSSAEPVAAAEPAVDVEPKPKPVAPSPPPSPPPRPRPAPVPPPPEAVIVDGVYFDGLAAGRALAFVNEASEDDLRRAGVYGRGVGVILQGRPFATLEAFGSTPQVGRKTVEAVKRAAGGP